MNLLRFLSQISSDCRCFCLNDFLATTTSIQTCSSRVFSHFLLQITSSFFNVPSWNQNISPKKDQNNPPPQLFSLFCSAPPNPPALAAAWAVKIFYAFQVTVPALPFIVTHPELDVPTRRPRLGESWVGEDGPGSLSHRIHVWYIYLHLPFSPLKTTKCR